MQTLIGDIDVSAVAGDAVGQLHQRFGPPVAHRNGPKAPKKIQRARIEDDDAAAAGICIRHEQTRPVWRHAEVLRVSQARPRPWPQGLAHTRYL